MFIKIIYMYFFGYVEIIVQGFFIERFLNLCKSNNIFIKDLYIEEKNTYLKASILKADFKEVASLAKKARCKVKIKKKSGLPFIYKKYKKRKIFIFAILILTILVGVLTNFVWNIEIVGNENISREEVLKLLNDNEIKIGKLKSQIDIEKVENEIRIQRDDLSWIGINIKGTNVIVTLQEAILKPEIINKNEPCDIVAGKDCVISRIIVQNGTAKVKPGDEVKKGDVLVSRIIESQYVAPREVHAQADVFGKIYYKKSKNGSFLVNEKIKTGNEENKKEICLNNFKINFDKRLSKFENYDTIITNKKIKFFSNFYFPVEIKNIKYVEIQNIQKEYSKDELQKKLEMELDEEIEMEFEISKFENKTREVIVNQENNGLTVTVIYEVQENVGLEKKY